MTEIMAGAQRLGRRQLLRGSLATAALVGASGTLVGCATGGPGSGEPDKQETGAKSDNNPFGIAEGAAVDAVIFNGGYGYDYVQFAADKMKAANDKIGEIKVAPSTQIAQELQPRFTGGNPPDLIDNSGAGAIGLRSILDQVEDLSDVLEANNYEGTKISDTLYPGVIESGMYDDKLAELRYVLSVYGVWYSASLFNENGWEPPRSWDEALALGAEAKKQDKYLFVWGKEAATYYQTLAIESAIKDGGDEVRLTIDKLEPNCWSHPAIQDAFKALETCVKQGYFVPGGAGTQFTAAQARWSQAQDAVLYPSGAWIENEMKDQTAEGFEMTGIPSLMANPDGGAMPYEAVHSTAGEPFLVPSKAKNVAGGKELLRAMLSAEASANFAKTKLAPTVVKGGIPEDAFGSTALKSQIAMLDAAGENTFHWIVGVYGMNPDQLVVWNTFLSGKADAAELTKGLQKITDKVANDDTVEKIEVT
jgi:N-acetylglucosamine transport system substrate-binding protein